MTENNNLPDQVILPSVQATLGADTARAGLAQSMTELMDSGAQIRVLKPGDMVQGTVLSITKNEIYIDLEGYGVGVVRGRELYDDPVTLATLKVGDEVTAAVVDTENKEGNVELSMRQAGHERVWQALQEKLRSREIVATKILSANKGGLMIELSGVQGFLPVSQLSLDHYPRVEEGDKSRILSALNKYVGQSFNVQVITADAEEEKLIVSEKAVYEQEMEQKLSVLKVGDTVRGQVTGVVDFGAFIKFGELEGLVHISEMAWQRVDNPRDLLKVGDEVTAKIIAIEKGRVSLSMKQLMKDPWLDAVAKYQIGQLVEGVVAKIVPFGALVELEKDVQGLAHLIELSDTPVKSADEVLKVGEKKQFKIIAIDPSEHRLGLSLKALTDPAKPESAEVIKEA